MRRRSYVLAAALALAPHGAAAKVKPEIGLASWYGSTMNGHPTASGEAFDRQRLTAAHRTLPLGSVIEVTNPKNGRKVIVTVNDRGPRRKDRILDLSPAAAAVLGFRHRGLAIVVIAPAQFE